MYADFLANINLEAIWMGVTWWYILNKTFVMDYGNFITLFLVLYLLPCSSDEWNGLLLLCSLIV